MKLHLVTLSLCFSFFCGAQNQQAYAWWNTIHNWDGVQSWSNYIPMVPGKMGPNALPVPDNQVGRIDTTLNFLLSQEVHIAPNDFTTNVFTRVNIPIKNAAALSLWWVPFEYFKTDSVVRDSRAARTRNATGTAMGDVYIGMHIPVITDKNGWPDLLLSINLKTASGTRLHDARFTDSPGYWFELSAGKTFNWSAKNTIRWYASSGFYVYQTNRTDYFQNDAFMIGGGIDVCANNFSLRVQTNSYVGYLNDFDTPLVVRCEMRYNLKKQILFARIQRGNFSYPFTSFRVGAEFILR